MATEATAYVKLAKGGHVPEPGGTYRFLGRRYRLLGIRLVGGNYTGAELAPHYPEMALVDGDHVAYVRLEPLEGKGDGSKA